MLSITIDRIGMEETLNKIDEFIAKKIPHLIVTPNIDHVILARKDAEFRHIYNSADLSVVDGVPLIWAARFLGHPLVERVNGTDLFVRLCERASQKSYKVFLLGAAPGVAARAADRLKNLYCGLQVTGTYSPPYDFFNNELENQKIVRMILNAEPDILFVALGAPKQEKWAYRYLQELGVPVIIGIGASFDYLSGHVKRAPRWMQRNGLEWLFRIFQQPSRYFTRYFGRDIIFIPIVLQEKILKLKMFQYQNSQ